MEPEITIQVEQQDKRKPKQITPVSVTPKKLSSVQKEIEPPDGHALVFPLDSEGNPIQGKWFFYPLRNVEKIYGNKDKFLIKKKANQ